MARSPSALCRRRCPSAPSRPRGLSAALTPIPSQVQVKQHVRLVLERLLHPVTRRVIVLDRENSLRVSAAPWGCCLRGMGQLRRVPVPSAAAPGPAACGDVPGLDAAGCGREGEQRREQLWSREGIGRSRQCPRGWEPLLGSRGGLRAVLYREQATGPGEQSQVHGPRSHGREERGQLMAGWAGQSSARPRLPALIQHERRGPELWPGWLHGHRWDVGQSQRALERPASCSGTQGTGSCVPGAWRERWG